MYQQLVAYVDLLCDRKWRRWQSLGTVFAFSTMYIRCVQILERYLFAIVKFLHLYLLFLGTGINDIERPPSEWTSVINLNSIKDRPKSELRANFALLKYFNKLFAKVLPVFDFSVREHWSVIRLARTCAKRLLFYSNKKAGYQGLFYRLYCEERPQFVILNRLASIKSRERAVNEDRELSRGGSSMKVYPELAMAIPESCDRIRSSLFYQLYRHIGTLNDPSSLRRRGQAWMVKFAGEGGHDVGGMYNESISHVCQELQSTNPVVLPFFLLCPNGQADIGENRSAFIPNSRCKSPIMLDMFSFIGRLMALGTLEGNGPTPLDFVPLVWKYLCGTPLHESDLKAFDFHTWKLYHTMMNLEKAAGVRSQEDFVAIFEDLDLRFTRISATGEVVELITGGKRRKVDLESALEFAALLLESALCEFDLQLAAIAHGFASIALPYHHLKIFGWKQISRLVSGFADIDLKLLKSKTKYLGRVKESDQHVVMFWKVLQEFSPEERQSFLKFVWGRTRLPASAVGFGKNVFKVQDHAKSLLSRQADKYLPVAHTCFFSLELPRYSSKSIMKEKLRYAIINCRVVDADNTLEGRSNVGISWS